MSIVTQAGAALTTHSGQSLGTHVPFVPRVDISKNLMLALHMGEAEIVLPELPPANPGDLIAVKTLPVGDTPGTTEWVAAGSGGGGGGGTPLPAPTGEGQILVSGVAPTFDWAAQNLIDAGRY